MVMFYSLYSAKGKIDDEFQKMSIVNIKSRVNAYYEYGSQGVANEDETEMKFVLSISSSPKFFEKKIDIEISYDHEEGKTEFAEISFELDRDKALKKGIKIDIEKTINLDGKQIKIKTLVASPTSTVIKGQIQNIIELGLDYIKNDRMKVEYIDMILIVNGKEMPVESSSMSTNLKGTNFELWFNALPEKMNDLELKIVTLTGDFNVEEKIPLEKGKSKEFKISGEDIKIEDVYEEEKNTFIVLTTDEETRLQKVNLNIDGKKVALEETIDGDYGEGFNELQEFDDEENFKYRYTRTLKFNGDGEKLSLEIDKISYKKAYDKIVYQYKK